MTTRVHAIEGAPCWADLWTSDVEGSRRFYGELFGWEAQAPSPEFGGYFMFARDGVPVAGAMGPMGDMPAKDLWKLYLATGDLAKTLEAAVPCRAVIASGAMPVADLGVQATLLDPGGAQFGLWQPGTFQRFAVLGEPGTPSWYELHTRDHAGAVAFYCTLLGLESDELPGMQGRAYTTLRDPEGGRQLAGILDATASLPEGAPAQWWVYWEGGDTDAAVAKVVELGGTVVTPPEATPFGRLATVADPAGARFKLRTSP